VRFEGAAVSRGVGIEARAVIVRNGSTIVIVGCTSRSDAAAEFEREIDAWMREDRVFRNGGEDGVGGFLDAHVTEIAGVVEAESFAAIEPVADVREQALSRAESLHECARVFRGRRRLAVE
jgi:hypothetical protein